MPPLNQGPRLFKFSDVSVRLDWTWFILAALIIWSLTTGYFPMFYPGQSRATYIWLGLFSMIGLMLSIIIHEYCHALVGRRFGMPIRGIRLFIFGGIAEMNEEPPSAKAEFLMAVAGPLASLLIGVVMSTLGAWGEWAAWPFLIYAVFIYLGGINFLLAIFNLLPAFPLDGGRILRAALWEWKKDLVWATRIASGIGRGFGLVLMFLGLLSLFSGIVLSGVWLVIIGLFLRSMAAMSYKGTMLRYVMKGVPVSSLVTNPPVTVDADMPVAEVVDKVFLSSLHELYPVMEGGRMIGCVTVDAVSKIDRKTWGSLRARDVMQPLPEAGVVDMRESIPNLLTEMNASRSARLLVTDGESGNRLVGVIGVVDLLKAFSVRERLRPV